MTKRLIILTAVAAAAWLATAAPASAASYLTVALGRGQWASATSQKTCSVQQNTVTLAGVAQALAARGIKPTVTVQLQFTQEATRHCVGQIMYASWSDLQSLHSTYGWEAVSAGDTTADYTTLSDADVRSHACGTLSAFQAHGFTRAWGMFAFPNSRSDARTQAIIDSCFSFFRGYSNTKTNTLPIAAPYRARTYSLTGGRCNDPASPCSTMPLPTTYVYLDPQQAISLINATPANGWAIFQGYRFVTGTTPTWDCSSSDWHDHWTHLQEEYCWGDYLHILDSLRSGFTYIDPAGAGILQGRSFAPAPAQAALHR
jgi:hypothetical protein